jgi:hypothetical protein
MNGGATLQHPQLQNIALVTLRITSVVYFLAACTVSMILPTTEGSESCLCISFFPTRVRVTIDADGAFSLPLMCRPTGPLRLPRSCAEFGA